MGYGDTASDEEAEGQNGDKGERATHPPSLTARIPTPPPHPE